MNGVDTVAQSLYFQATLSQNSAAKKKEKSPLSKKATFASSLHDALEKEEMLSAGIPLEVIDKPIEEAVVFLKDSLDKAGDELVEKMTNDAFAKYRKSIQMFMLYVEKKSFALEVRRKRFRARRYPRDTFVQIKIINSKLEQLASDVLYNHADKMRLLAKVGEINGLIVDILAS